MTVNKLLVVALLLAAALPAQIQTGRIVGTVYDPNKAVVPNAAVVITNTATNQAQSVTTNGAGDFVLTPVNPGVYRVEVTAKGFGTAQVNSVEVVVGQSARVDVDLRIGDTSTRIEVVAATAMLNTESGTLGQEVTNKQIVDLPLNGRSFYELARLTPGATLLPGTGNLLRIRANYESGTSISGVRGTQTSFYLDGVDTTDHHQGGTLIQTSIDALQEFQIQQSEYSAEFRNAGGVLNGTTKSGTNSFHGVLFEFLRNDKLDSRNFFALQRDVLKRNQFGGGIGGPLSIPKLYNGKNRTFFFLNYEGMRQRAGQVFNNLVPSPAEKSGDFSAAGLNTIYDPTNAAPFPGNRIPTSRLSSQAQFFAKYLSDPNSGNRAIFAPSQVLDQDQFTVRVDQTITNNHRAFVRYSFINYQENDPNAFPALGYASLNTRGHNFVAALNSNLKPTLINEARFSYLPNSIDLTAFLQGTNFYTQAGVPGFEDTGHRPGDAGSFPDFGWSGYASLSGSTFDQRPKTQDLKVWEYSDNLTWIKGKHILKFGAQVRHWVPLFTDSGVYEGQWNFNGSITQNPAKPAGTGDAFADFMLGIPTSVGRNFPADWFGGLANYWHFYAQDDFKVSSRLTLNIGLRYEYSPWLDGYKGQVGAILPNSPKPILVQAINLDAQFAAPTANALFGHLTQTCSQAGIAANCTATDKTQFAPRFGFAWRPLDDKTVIRGGYGIFYEVESSGNRVNHNMVPYTLSETVFNDGLRTMATFFQGRPIGGATTAPSLTGGYPNMPMGYDQHWSFGLQRQLPGASVLEVNYVGNRGVNLYEGNPINDPLAGPGSIQARRPYPIFGGITYNGQDNSTIYHALQAKFEKRVSGGLWYLVSYTWSKSINLGNTPSVGGDYAYERAISSFDIPQNLTASAGYELPVGKGKKLLASGNRFANGVLGGWQLQGIVVLRSGRPFTPTISRDVANTGIGGQRPIRLGSGQLSNPTISQWFDKTAFAVPAAYTWGNSGADILREDRFKNLDLSLFKQFRINERCQVQFRAEAFNLTNSPSFSAPGSNIDTAAGGVVTSTISTPRNIQFGLKLNF
ncbi:MAG: carboxypeptidase-like regulatory domain-containing protein [Acidobacteriia bacterium]|nr:carboxypeptidase-like regulatory domain-containing protein [Terriglobia bacterium]